MREIEKTPAAPMPRAAYVVEGSSTFIGVFGSGSAARCRVVSVMENYVSIEVMTVPQTKDRFHIDAELGLIKLVPSYVFGNHEAKALWRLQQLSDMRFMRETAAPQIIVPDDCKVIDFRPSVFDSVA